MREIKFRLRDRHNKIVGYEKWYAGDWYYDNDANMHPDSGYWRASPCWLYSVYGEYWLPTYIPHRYKDQYTGLKDKNGVEIYEGDIVSSFYFVEQIGEVKQHESGEWYLDYGDIGTDSLLSELERWKGEVIGNIYSNPELLGEK